MKKIIISLNVLVFSAVMLSAQPRTGYFVDNFYLNHNFNSSFAPKNGYIGIPVLSNFNLGIHSNIGAATLLYPLDNGKLGTFLHKDVSAEESLGKLSSVNYLDMSLNLDLISAAWYGGGDRFWTFDIGLRTDITTSLPYELFRFAKEGMYANSVNYDINGTGIAASIYGQAAIGFSSGLNSLVEGLRIGGKLKFLVSMADIQAKVDNLNVSMNADMWSATSVGTGHLYGKFLTPVVDPKTGYVTSFDTDWSSISPVGMGGAIDFGISYTISEGTVVDGLRFSVSVADLGFISYFKDKATMFNANGEFKYSGVENLTDPDGNSKEQFDRLTDDLLQMVGFTPSAAESDQLQMITTKIYAGVDYTFFNSLNLGVLYSSRINRFRTEHEVMVACNYSPAEWFNIGASYSFMNTKSTIGWILSFAPRAGVNFFLASDYTALNYTPQGLPVKSGYLTLNLGLSVPLGNNVAKRSR